MAYVKKLNLRGPQGIQGERGPQGLQGVKGETGPQGPQGAKGDAFAIAKTYTSVAAMNAGFASDGVKQGQFVLIDTGNVNNADNAKLYVKGTTAYTYLTDLSGATGMTGPQGPQGMKGETGAQGVKGETGPQGLKGETGATGPAGKDGSQITSGAGAPATGNTGKTGDMYLDTTTGDLYIYEA